MEKDNKEIVFELITIIAALLGAYFGNQYLIITAVASVSIALWFWYSENIVQPLKAIASETKELRKDLNMRKEIEDLKVKMVELKVTTNKKGGINPFLFIVLVLLLVMLVLYLKEKGFI